MLDKAGGVRLIALFLNRGVAPQLHYLRLVINERPTIEHIAGKGSDLLRLKLIWILHPSPVFRYGFRILTGNIETDLRGAIGKYVLRERELVHPLGGEDKRNAVLPGLR